jgi:hypothetical protein
VSADQRPCACDCGGLLPADARGNRKYLDGHRTRGYRNRLAERAEAAGLPAAISLKSLQAMPSTHEPSRDAPTARDKRSRLSARASKDPQADKLARFDAMQELRNTQLYDHKTLARLGGRIQKLSRRLAAHEQFVKTYGEEPHGSAPAQRAA